MVSQFFGVYMYIVSLADSDRLKRDPGNPLPVLQIPTDTGVWLVEFFAHVDTACQRDAVALDARTVRRQFAAHQCDDRRPTQLRTGRRRAPVAVDDVIADAAQPLVVFQSSTKQHIRSVLARP